MASVAAAYPNSNDSGSGKERHYFSAAEVQEFFETCPPELVAHRDLRTMHCMFLALKNKLKKPVHGSELRFQLSIEDYRKAGGGGPTAYKSASAVRYNLRRCERAGHLEVVYRDEFGKSHHLWIRPRTATDRGYYSRVPTYRLSTSLLVKWREHRRRDEQVTPIRKAPRPEPPPLPPAPAAPAPARKAAEHRSNARQARKLTPREGPKLVNEMRRLMQGVKGHAGPDHLWVEYSSGDPRYRAPMSQEDALVAACMALAIPENSAREFLKLLPRDLVESDPPPLD